MRLEARKYLYDIQRAVALLTEFTAGKACRSRTRISEHRRIIAFRNILIHAYADVDERLVWDVVETKLPVLSSEIEALLNSQ